MSRNIQFRLTSRHRGAVSQLLLPTSSGSEQIFPFILGAARLLVRDSAGPSPLRDPAKHGSVCPAPCSSRSRGWSSVGVPLMLPLISSPSRRRAQVLLQLIGSYWKDLTVEANAHLTSSVRLTSLFNLQSGTIQATAYKRLSLPNIHEVNIVANLQTLRM